MNSGSAWAWKRVRGGWDSLSYRRGRSQSRALILIFLGVYGSKIVIIVEGKVIVGIREIGTIGGRHQGGG